MNVAKKLAPAPSTLLAEQLLKRTDGEVTRLIVVRHPFNRCPPMFLLQSAYSKVPGFGWDRVDGID